MVQPKTYSVGGVNLAQPFKIRRLGHVAFDIGESKKALEFFVRDLGFTVSDPANISKVPGLEEVAKTLEDPHVYFLSLASDHHTVVLFPREAALVRRGPAIPPEITNGQMSFQVNSVAEVVDGKAYLESQGMTVPRLGRDMPGSNWHTYFIGPDNLTVELYYGMEQMGWARKSKPRSMYHGAVSGEFDLPITPEYQEVLNEVDEDKNIHDGHTGLNPLDAEFNVDGVMLPRPFRAHKLGPCYFFVDDVDVSVDFYTNLLGFNVTEKVECLGETCVYLTANSDHHMLGLLPKSLRSKLGLSSESTNLAVGLQVGSYDQLRKAGLFLASRGWTLKEDLPAELTPGVSHKVFVEDARGNRIMLYFHMEQLGWSGEPCPNTARPKPETRPVAKWPETIDAASDVYRDYPLMGPLG